MIYLLLYVIKEEEEEEGNDVNDDINLKAYHFEN
mgnify:CR=1 FL=1